MKQKYDEVLKACNPLPYRASARAVNRSDLNGTNQIAYTGDTPHAALLTHSANVLPGALEALRRASIALVCVCSNEEMRQTSPCPSCIIDKAIAKIENVEV